MNLKFILNEWRNVKINKEYYKITGGEYEGNFLMDSFLWSFVSKHLYMMKNIIKIVSRMVFCKYILYNNDKKNYKKLYQNIYIILSTNR